MADQRDTWKREKAGEVIEHHNLDENISGPWRIVAAKTKPDTPVYIWREDGQDATIFQIGRQQPMNSIDHREKWFEFLTGSWLKCRWVERSEWDTAMETGYWADGKPSWQPDAAPAKPEGNEAPVAESLADQIAALAETLDAVAEPTTQLEADRLSGMQDRMRALIKQAGEQQEKEFRPHKEAADAVSARWRGIKRPGEDALTAAEALRKAFLKKEQARVDAIAEAKRKAQQAIVDAENEKIRKANEARMAEAQDRGADFSDPTETVPELLPEVAAPVIEAPRARSGSAFGRQTGLKKVTVGKIVDFDKFLKALAGHREIKELAQTLANRAAKAGVPVDGMEITEEWQ